jgi:NADPH:quinone reductase-like Zn-dependent oxidoreductase
MRAYVLPKGSNRVEQLCLIERPDPQPGHGQVLVRIRAASLNFRDQAVASGQYLGGVVSRDLIPLSDGAGEVVAVGPGVMQVKVGDRVAGTFFQRTAPSALAPFVALGAMPRDGVLAEQVVFYEDGVVPLPRGYSFEEGACLPCAAVTAWHALMRAGRPVRPGDTMLALGTGGVSTFAVQFARAAGARVIVTSSSDEKLARARALGAVDGINYTRTPEWDQQVLSLTGGRGADCVIEVGGVNTMSRSFSALARGGKVCLIGLLAGREGAVSPYALMSKGGSLHGIFVGDRDMFLEMNRAIDANGIKPVVDRVVPFEQALDAYRTHAAGKFVGKVVITLD